MTRTEAETYIDVLEIASNHRSGDYVTGDVATPDGIIYYEGTIHYNTVKNYVDGYFERAFTENEEIEYNVLCFTDNDNNETDLLEEVA